MNAKKLKSLRKDLRTSGSPAGHVVTVEPAPGRNMSLVGIFVRNAGFAGQRILHRTCGRAIYQAAKRAIKRTGASHAV